MYVRWTDLPPEIQRRLRPLPGPMVSSRSSFPISRRVFVQAWLWAHNATVEYLQRSPVVR